MVLGSVVEWDVRSCLPRLTLRLNESLQRVRGGGEEEGGAGGAHDSKEVHIFCSR